VRDEKTNVELDERRPQ